MLNFRGLNFGIILFLGIALIPLALAENCRTDGITDNCWVTLEYVDEKGEPVILEINPDPQSIKRVLKLIIPEHRTLDDFLSSERGRETLRLFLERPMGPWKYKNFLVRPKKADLEGYLEVLWEIVSPENKKASEPPYGYVVKFKETPLKIHEKYALGIGLKSQEKKIKSSHQVVFNYIRQNFPQANVRHEFTKVFNGISLEISQKEAEKLKKLEVVEAIYPIKRVHASLDESVGMINADDVWELKDDLGVNIKGNNFTIAIIDTGVDYSHPDFGNCSPEQIGGTIYNYSLESAHPYLENTNQTWTITRPGFSSIAVHFSKIDVESYYDKVIIRDATGNSIKEYSGNYSDIWSPSVTGDTIQVTLESDYMINGWGFAIDQVLNGTTSTSWDSCSKVGGGYDFANDDDDPMDDTGHGTHCAGIALGNGSLKGVAPNAKLLIYKVLDSQGSGWEDDIIAGIERAVNDSADVISLSLGGTGNPDDALSQAVDNAVNSGVVVVVAVGNDGPSSGTISSPACARKAIAVGATYKESDASQLKTSSLYVVGETLEEISSEPLDHSAATPGGGITAELLFAGLGYPENFTGQNFGGKIALIERGQLYFYEKVQNAYEVGSIGAIIYNNQLGNFLGNLINLSQIPAISISRTDGLYLKSLRETGTTTVNMSVLTYEKIITDFSSRGPIRIYNKPDLVAPGAFICSSQWDDVYPETPCFDSEHVAISGTSMATPHVAGAAALILQKHPNWTPDEVKYALLNTAQDQGCDDNEEGTGLMDVLKAVNLTHKPPLAIISDLTGLEYRS